MLATGSWPRTPSTCSTSAAPSGDVEVTASLPRRWMLHSTDPSRRSIMSAIDVVGQYGAAMAAGDMEALAATFHPDAVWHQPGANQLSGDHVGPDAIIAHLGRFMQLSGGTFALETESATE